MPDKVRSYVANYNTRQFILLAATCKTFTQYPSNKQSFNSEDLAHSSLMQCADKRSYHSEI